uniref:uncharacterized protein LOC120336308 isoform X2 n=1 Tax=Styela clava TaxID=7725 RepID=UPI00193A924F|nr:uncharacterized protein LOC120336308 isoform X2 [Styela clava]
MQSHWAGTTKDNDPINFKFEIGDRDGKKWISQNRSLHDNIPVQLNPSVTEAWELERSKNEALWSFYILLDDGKKMYVTYNFNSDDVTLEELDDITQNNGKGSVSLSRLAEIRNDPIANKWVYQDAKINAPIQVQQTGALQEWQLNFRDSGRSCEFSAGNLYAEVNISQLLFGSVPAEFTWHDTGGGVLLKCKSNNQYVVAPEGSGDLHFLPGKKNATVWDIMTTRIVLKYKDKTIIVPYYDIV